MSKNTIIILGTRHLSQSDFPEYHDRLKSIIEEISPDIICSELSPEQLNGNSTCNSKPEQRDVIIPLAQKLSIPIIPIQPNTEIGLKREKEKANIINEIVSSDSDKAVWDCICSLIRKIYEGWRNQMKNPECIENSQLQEFHIFSASIDDIFKDYFPNLYNYYAFSNKFFLSKIKEVLKENKNKKILVIVGLGHKYWLWEELLIQDDVELYDVQSYRKANK